MWKKIFSAPLKIPQDSWLNYYLFNVCRVKLLLIVYIWLRSVIVYISNGVAYNYVRQDAQQ